MNTMDTLWDDGDDDDTVKGKGNYENRSSQFLFYVHRSACKQSYIKKVTKFSMSNGWNWIQVPSKHRPTSSDLSHSSFIYKLIA